ncbi:helix-turn-helix domain-containing protein [Enhygromyxa salina]|uniref:Anaerobic benzoate catabolism transcriptional regulator n=1 Tax=Enhygromyxa salina TaxID=215803 RepID=A0A2S9Y0D2_9BACT|nr:helix-turn-helix domain-containing protein [Enhygromyxa salina]PRP98556.1 anaerobic benzoate catabolism transcriptional regulator [Enhygromyxa salina]
MSDQQAAEQPARVESDRRFGRHVKSCRRARGLTQEALAERSQLSPDTIRRLERGTFSPSLDALRKLCMGLQMQLSALFDSFDLGEREAARELGDALAGVTPEVQEALFQLVAVLRRQRGDD